MLAVAEAFDSMADRYDAEFTRTIIGKKMRAAVWRRCAVRFPKESRVLELNCGTGEDALWLARRGVQVLATDISSAMLRVAEEKWRASTDAAPTRFQKLAWEDLDGLDTEPLDGALSNFGGLNCVADLAGAGCALASKLRPGAVAVLCIMGRMVPWEWLWYLARGDAAKAFRRFRRGGSEWSGTRIFYPTIAQTQAAFKPGFRLLRVSALGALLPPPYTERLAHHAPRLVAGLDWMERRLETYWPLPQLADHFLLELERV